MIAQPAFLPMFRSEAEKQGIDQLDVILISGDAYVDHPSFSAALVGRVLWDAGYSVGIIAQPAQKEDFLRLGKPRLFLGISSGNVDSMVNHFTANLKRRSSDVYSPGGRLLRRRDPRIERCPCSRRAHGDHHRRRQRRRHHQRQRTRRQRRRPRHL